MSSVDSEPIRARQRLFKTTILAATILSALLVRWIAVSGSDFPLMDGGMFFAMVRDLQASHFALPLFTSYNAAHIPFAYPPLALYLAAALQSLTGWRLEEIFRWLPLAVDILTIPAFYALSRAVLRPGWAAAAATLVFALLPEPIHWLLMGGGLTRAVGYLFALLALRSIYLMYTRGRRRDVILAALYASGVVLSHFQMAWFVVYSAALMALFFGRDRRGLWNSLIVGLSVLLLTSPWWVTVFSRHGWAPYLASTGHGWPVFNGLSWLFLTGGTGEPFVPLLAFAAVLGLVVCLLKRVFWLPAWLLATFALDGWVPTTTGAAPLALLAGVGVTEALWPLLAGAGGSEDKAGSPAIASGRRALVARWTLIALAAYAVFSTAGAGALTLTSLSPDEREAMHWVSQNTPQPSRFLVVTSERWPVDRSSEWFPVLAERQSVGTVQGAEWLPGGEFGRRVARNDQLIACPQEGVGCLERWIGAAGVLVTHIYLPKRRASLYTASMSWQTERPDDCCGSLREGLAADPGYALVYDNPGAAVYVRRGSMP